MNAQSRKPTNENDERTTLVYGSSIVFSITSFSKQNMGKKKKVERGFVSKFFFSLFWLPCMANLGQKCTKMALQLMRNVDLAVNVKKNDLDVFYNDYFVFLSDANISRARLYT